MVNLKSRDMAPMSWHTSQPNLGSLGTLQGPTPDSLTAHARLKRRAPLWTLEPIHAERELGMMETHGFNQLNH